jgi:hypothetical protein
VSLAVAITQALPPGGAVVVLVDRRNEYAPVYLASDAPGREVWNRAIDAAKIYPTLGAAQRVALQARRRPGRAQPYAIPARAAAEITAGRR